MKKTKVLIITNRRGGGVGTFLRQLANLDSVEFVLVSVKLSSGQNIGINNQYSYGKGHQLEKSRLYNPLSYLQLLNESFWVRRVIERERPEIIITIDIHACLLGVLSCLFLFAYPKIKIISTIHNNYPLVISEKIPWFFRMPLKVVCEIFFTRVEVFVCVSRGLADNFKQYFHLNNKVEVIVNGLNVGEGSKRNCELTQTEKGLFGNNYFTIMSIGRFEPQKDFLTLIKAFSILSVELKNARLVLIGKGRQESMLRNAVTRLRIGEKVHFLGWKKNINQYLDQASIFVLSTRYEAFGYVLLEAMSRGVPVISTDVPFGPSEILGKGKYGILAKPLSEDNLAELMLKLHNDKKLRNRLSKNGRERVKKYSQTVMVASYKKLIENILS